MLRRWRLRQVHQAAPASAWIRGPGRRGRRPPGSRLSAALVDVLARHPGRLVPALAVAGLAIAGAYVAFSGAYMVHGATVSGNQRVTARVIYEASGLHGTSILGADTTAAAQRIMALDGIRQARVRTVLPNRVAIVVEETQPALLWQSEAAVVAVDEGGLALPAPADPGGLVRVRDLGNTLQAPGQRVDPLLVDAALAYAARFGDLAYRPDIGFTAASPEGWEVRLGTDARQAARQVTLLAAARTQLAAQSPAIALLDLRVVSRPYYRLRGETE